MGRQKHRSEKRDREVERAEKAPGGGQLSLGLSGELGKRVPRQVDETSDITEHQIREGLWMLVSQPLHEEVRKTEQFIKICAQIGKYRHIKTEIHMIPHNVDVDHC
ncbi:hypothetical protein EYF80_014543 [Liparis tanakae]|uniref:Uncharacterized protein n=1 Tax=Liparis tanakae TaxID=230148 RepID=A0A4Z2IBD9_9TELE|nr:hypothetical protein EYF80_014543 [Liparis tanakae]